MENPIVQERFTGITNALYSLSHMIEIVGDTEDQITLYELSALLKLMADGVLYRRQLTKLGANN
ncbi:Uncharacterised protein [Haemophilus parahaemolyticus]|uniref:Uncharacterized protein n=1 Tax=Haemophilus parahaemolyticus TaxID=735 RepID=A0A377I350_HAEPH|nr:hypothetical protein [Haemophilus parahaemolyticus]STO64769.1 Uncharacterised protein [Haemophilus parahaemolyticus]